MLFPNERKAMKKYLSSFDEKHSVNVELEEKLFKGSYYKITRYDSEYIYYGEISENKPNGLGIIKRKINKSIIENSIENMEQSDSSEDVFFTVYAGYFKEGMPSGYGLQFASPLDEDYVSLIVNFQLFYQNIDDDMQKSVMESLNPLIYEGEFDKGKYNGVGVEYSYDYIVVTNILVEMPDSIDKDIEDFKNITIYQGEFSKGKQNGKAKIYLEGYLLYEGDIKGGKRTGAGVIYYDKSNQIQYKGELIDGIPNGKGTRYNEDGTIEYSGEWDMGDYAG